MSSDPSSFYVRTRRHLVALIDEQARADAGSAADWRVRPNGLLPWVVDGKPRVLQLAVSARPPVTRRPDPASGACFGLANSPWLRPFPPATPQALARPCSPPSTVLLPHPTSSFRTSSDTESSFPLRPRSDCRGRMKTSQVPTKDVRTCMGSSTPWRPPSPHRGGDVGVAFDGAHSLGAPDDGSFDAQ